MIIENEIKNLIEETNKYNPEIGKYFLSDISLDDFSKKINEYNALPIHLDRQKGIKNVVQKYLLRIFPDDTPKFETNPDQGLVINIVDHHGILNHPMSFGANIISNYSNLFNPNKSIIVFSTANITLDDAFHERGFKYHSQKIRIFTNRIKDSLVAFYPKVNFNYLENLKNSDQLQNFSDDEINFLQGTQKYLNEIDYSNAENFSDQITILVDQQWKKLFKDELRDKLARLIIVPQESIMKNAFNKFIKKDNSFIWKSLFDKNIREDILSQFEGIYGAWDKEHGKGTHFFWVRRKNLELGRLRYENGVLIAEDDDSFVDKINFDPESIINELEKGSIYPSLFLIFAFLIFYAGIKPLCGFGSATYLTKMKNAWSKIFDKYFPAEKNNIKDIPVSELIGGPILAYARNNENKLIDSWAFDLMESGGLSQSYIEKIGNIPYKDLLLPCLPEMNQNLAVQLGIPEDQRGKYNLTMDDLVNKVFSWVK